VDRAGIPKMKTWVYETTVPAGRFREPLVVTMRPMTPAQVATACRLPLMITPWHAFVTDLLCDQVCIP